MTAGTEERSRPGWRGPGSSKKKKPERKQAKAKSDSKVATHDSLLPVELQQLLLNVVRDAFPSAIGSDSLISILQEIKQALFERDFERAFSKDEFLQSYAVRWSPSRALCYATLLADLHTHFASFLVPPAAESVGLREHGNSTSQDPDGAVTRPSLRVICFGGGAAEVVAFGGWLKHLRAGLDASKTMALEKTAESLSLSDPYSSWAASLLLIDSAGWGDVVQVLRDGLVTAPSLSKYASPAARAANSPLLPDTVLRASFQRHDVLKMTSTELETALGKDVSLVTLLFTLNELYTTSITSTTKFLLDLTSAAPQNTLLLVVDSPGSYSETSLGKEKKKYPMEWLMDHTLLGKDEADEAAMPRWEKILSDVRWFRLAEQLRYPISLENMRYQVHLYRRT